MCIKCKGSGIIEKIKIVDSVEVSENQFCKVCVSEEDLTTYSFENLNN
jgi:DnaJ-class molecular chaperone